MMSFKSLPRGMAAAVFATLVLTGAANAQNNVGDRLTRLEQQVQRLQGPAGTPGAAVSPSDIEGRLLSMERAIELLTGQVEEARFRSERSAEQLKVLTDDVNLRLATLEQSIGVAGGAAPGNAPGAATPTIAPTPSAPPRPNASAPAPQRFSADAPASQPMNVPRAAPPAPDVAAAGNAAAASGEAVAANGGFVVRTDASGKPLPPDPNAPAPVKESGPPPSAPAPRASPAAPSVTGNQLAALPADIAMPNGAPKQQYDYAFDFLKRNDYIRGEAALREFLKRNPKDQLAGNAQYWLGETFYVRGNYQQAAVEFMAGYQTFPKNAKSPDSLFKLGLSLEKLNQNDGACTAFGRITKDYPDASDQVRNGVKAERTKLKCK